MISALLKLGTWLASRPRTRPITTIVLHATAGGSFAGAWSTLRVKGFGYHALICSERDPYGDGAIVKCVPDLRTCAHAGKSVGPAGPSVNSYSLGCSFVNLNDGHDPYSEKQHAAAVERVFTWAMAYPSIEWLTTHYWVSPGRKTDPKGYDVLRLLTDVNSRLEVAGRPGLRIWRPH